MIPTLAQGGQGCNPVLHHPTTLASPVALSPEFVDKLRTSALGDQQISRLVAAGYHVLQSGELVIPYRNPDGSPLLNPDGTVWTRRRLSRAQIAAMRAQGEEHPPKYLSAQGSGCRVYHPVLSDDHQRRLGRRKVALRITEGEFKAEACAAHDPRRVTVGLGGVASWRDQRSGQSAPIPELEAIPVEGREVRLCFDSDVHKPEVRGAMGSLAMWLHRRGARVLVERLPNAHQRNGLGEVERLGADDLIWRYGAAAFLSICEVAEPCIKITKEADENGPEEACFVMPLDPEPKGAGATFFRQTFLHALIGSEWRADPSTPNGWWHWNGRHWQQVDGSDCLLAAVERFLDCQGWREARIESQVRGLVAAFRRMVGTLEPAAMAGLLPCRNGVLRLSDGVLLPHRPENGNTWALAIDWNPAVDHRPVERFLADVLGDPADVAVFRAFAHDMVLGIVRKVFLELTGPGDSGKSVVARLVVALAGEGNYAAMELASLEDRGERFETYRLRGKRLAILSESQDYAGPLERLKALTGGDPIRAERKRSTTDHTFYFHGQVLVTGNAPVRPSDASAATLNRRRPLVTPRVVPPSQQRSILDPAEGGGWTGELAPFLPGLLRWVLEMPEAEARAALARDNCSPSRVEAELVTLLESDSLAAWADEWLVFDDTPGTVARVGTAKEHPSAYLYAHYCAHMANGHGGAVALRKFKAKLVSLLRDSLGVPLPAGSVTQAPYQVRLQGSVIPCVRLRNTMDGDAPGIVRAAFQARLNGAQVQSATPRGPLEPLVSTSQEGRTPPPALLDRPFADDPTEPVPAPAARPEVVAPQPGAGVPIRVDGNPGYRLPGVMPKGDGPTVKVLVVTPSGHSQQVERHRIELAA